MASVNIYDAKTRLSKLLKRVRAGEEIIIADAGKPVAKLVPFEQPRQPRVLGAFRGQVWIAGNDDPFSALTAEEIEALENNPIDPPGRLTAAMLEKRRPAKRKPTRMKKR